MVFRSRTSSERGRLDLRAGATTARSLRQRTAATLAPCLLAVAVAGLASALPAVAAERPSREGQAPLERSARVIVSLTAESTTLRQQILSAHHSPQTVAQVAQGRADRLAAHAGVALTAGRLVGPRAQVVTADGIDSVTLAARLATHPEVEYAVPDRRVRAMAVPNDPLYAAGPANGKGPAVGQWYLHPPDATIRSAVNAQGAWDYATGSPSIVVGVLDGGVLAGHPDLVGRVLPGYDLIGNVAIANDGNGRDSDASDPGDWITVAEDTSFGGFFEDCGVSDSSWHGTSVSGIIGAAANNGIGMAGIASGVRVLPVRVLGKCGGFESDSIAGVYWAAGISQPGLPGSPTPARVLNLSLGHSGACSPAVRDVVSAITAPPYNALMVAAAGNGVGHAVLSPANCPGVVAVTGLRHVGSKIGFSNVGPEVTIAAPGGNCVNLTANLPCLYPILSATNSGTTVPLAGGSTWSDSDNITVGTSFAAPIVSGALALMLSARPSLTPAQLISTISATARPFPTTGADNGGGDPTPVPMCHAPDGTNQLQCYCSVGICGAGMLDVAAAVLSVVQQATPSEGARQLLDFGERAYPQYFAGHPATQSSPPFLYRYYPATGAYLGVAVQSDAAYVLNGIYVFGGPFGNQIRYVGRVGDYITVRASAVPAPRDGAAR